jgi:feruloyl esterase
MHGSKGVYVTGVSAGGAFTAVMLATYPERFSAGSIMAGIPYKCATDLSMASSCTQGTTKTPEQWGELVHSAYNFSGPYPRVQIWHGAMDYTVNTANATELVKQWTNVWNTDATADASEMISTATRTQYTAGSTVAVELYMVSGMGHGIAIGGDNCPATSGAFFVDAKICSTLRAAEFFGLTGSGGPDGSHGDDSAQPRSGGCNSGRSVGLGTLMFLIGVVVSRAAWRRRSTSTRSS